MKKTATRRVATSLKPKKGITYVCSKSFTDTCGDRARKGQKFHLDATLSDMYLMGHAAGWGMPKTINKQKFTNHFVQIG
jgi:hypothetical protein